MESKKHRLRRAAIACVAIAMVYISPQPLEAEEVRPVEAQPAPVILVAVPQAQEAPEPIEEDGFVLYDIPMSEELQRYTYELCEERGLDCQMVIAMMSVESGFQAEIVSATGDYGIMQINRVNHEWLGREVGVTDFLDAQQCIDAGTYILTGIAEDLEDTHMILMSYNCGPGGAAKLWEQGVYSTAYSRKVVERMSELEVAE